MLVLTRKVGERILIGNDVEIRVVHISGNRVRLALVGPQETVFLRAEKAVGDSAVKRSA